MLYRRRVQQHIYTYIEFIRLVVTFSPTLEFEVFGFFVPTFSNHQQQKNQGCQKAKKFNAGFFQLFALILPPYLEEIAPLALAILTLSPNSA